MRKTLSFLFAASLALGQAEIKGSDKPVSLAEAIKMVSPSVVQIIYDLDQLPEETRHAVGRPFVIGAAGTGFIVNEDGYVITALHVLSTLNGVSVLPIDGHAYPLGKRNRLLIGIAVPNTDTGPAHFRAAFSMTEFTVVDTDSVHDLAILKPTHPLFDFHPLGPRHAVTFAVVRPTDGDRVAVSGYPLGNQVLVTTSGAVASSWGYEERQVPLPDMPEIKLPEIKDVFLVDLHLNHGNSGGPVYSVDTGAVIGVADAFAEDNVMLSEINKPAIDGVSKKHLMANAGLGVVVPARYVVDLLRKNNVKWIEK